MLRKLMNARFESDVAELRQLAARESVLEKALEDLNKRSFERSDDGNETARHIGADWAWTRWADHKRKEINTILAQIRARKMDQHARAAKAFGRREASSVLVQKSSVEQRAEHKKAAADKLQALLVQQPGKGFD